MTTSIDAIDNYSSFHHTEVDGHFQIIYPAHLYDQNKQLGLEHLIQQQKILNNISNQLVQLFLLRTPSVEFWKCICMSHSISYHVFKYIFLYWYIINSMFTSIMQ